MIDIQNLKNNLPETIENLSRRGFEFNEDYWLKTEEKRKKLQIETEQLQEIQNNLASLKLIPIMTVGSIPLVFVSWFISYFIFVKAFSSYHIRLKRRRKK